MQIRGFETQEHHVDFCVVGGGMAGLIAAVSAAKHGAKVLLMQDRPVLDGNASSEVRMWICGAHGPDAKETGLLQEIMLANYYRNRNLKYSVWDTVLYEKAKYQEGITLLLNCSCHEMNTEGEHITSIKGWQTSTQTFHQVHAKYFADCSGDSVLRISGAEFRRGRESRHEFGETHAPEPLRRGIDRVIDHEDNGWWAAPNECVTYTFDSPVLLSRVRLIFDSNQDDKKRMPCWYPKSGTTVQNAGYAAASICHRCAAG